MKGERNEDIIYRVANVIKDLAKRRNAKDVIGDVYRDRDRILDRIADDRLGIGYAGGALLS